MKLIEKADLPLRLSQLKYYAGKGWVLCRDLVRKIKSQLVSENIADEDAPLPVFRDFHTDNPLMTGVLHKKSSKANHHNTPGRSGMWSAGLALLGGIYFAQSEVEDLQKNVRSQVGVLWPVTWPSCADESAVGNVQVSNLSDRIALLENFDTLPDAIHTPQAWSSELARRYGVLLPIIRQRFSLCTEIDKRQNHDIPNPTSIAAFEDAVLVATAEIGLTNLAHQRVPFSILDSHLELHYTRAYNMVDISQRERAIRDRLRSILLRVGSLTLSTHGSLRSNTLGAPNAQLTISLADHVGANDFPMPVIEGDGQPETWLLPSSVLAYSPYRVTDVIHQRLRAAHTNSDVIEATSAMAPHADFRLVTACCRDTRSAFLNATDMRRMRAAINRVFIAEPRWSTHCWHGWSSTCATTYANHNWGENDQLHALEYGYDLLGHHAPSMPDNE